MLVNSILLFFQLQIKAKEVKMGNIIDAIDHKKILVSDGAWGTMLQSYGFKTGDCPEYWNIEHPEIVMQIAQSYIDAGADIIETNSFGGSKIKLKHFSLDDKCYELNFNAAKISREAAKNKLVMGSVGPTGKFLSMGEITKEELFDSFYAQIKGLVDGGVDAVCIETFYDLDEAEIAFNAAKEFENIDIITSFTFDKTSDGEYFSIMGVTPEEMTKQMIDFGADIIGSNCGNGFENMIEISKKIHKTNSEIPILVQANAGIPELIDNKIVYSESPEFASRISKEIIKNGVNIIGGCCGTTPEHIKLIRKTVDEILGEVK